MDESFSGYATIKVIFKNAGEYAAFRKYILRTGWMVSPACGYPMIEEMTLYFTCSDDVEKVTRTIVQLLQYGFEVYSSQWKLDVKDPAEDEHPEDDEPEEENWPPPLFVDSFAEGTNVYVGGGQDEVLL